MIAWKDSVSEAAPGEALVVDERLVLSPCSGRFRPTPPERDPAEGTYVLPGEVVGSVVSSSGEVVPVRSPFAGWMMGFMIPDGAPVRGSEPVVWLRCR
jgi:hypothetical protein